MTVNIYRSYKMYYLLIPIINLYIIANILVLILIRPKLKKAEVVENGEVVENAWFMKDGPRRSIRSIALAQELFPWLRCVVTYPGPPWSPRTERLLRTLLRLLGSCGLCRTAQFAISIS